MNNEDLVFLIQNGDKSKIEILWAQIEPFVNQQANRWTGYAEYDDLRQEAYFFFLDAVSSYKQSKNTKFISWLGNRLAWGWQRWISDSMLGFHLPAWTAAKMLQYERICKECEKTTGTTPTTEQLCYLLKCSMSELQIVKQTIKRIKIRSLQERVGEDENTELQEFIADDEDFTENVLDRYQQEQLKNTIWPIVETLEERQAAVIRERYKNDHTLDDISADLGISKERVRQIEARGLQMLRRPKNKKKLQPFYEDDLESRAMQGTGVSWFTKTWTSATEREALRNYEKSSRSK